MCKAPGGSITPLLQNRVSDTDVYVQTKVLVRKMRRHDSWAKIPSRESTVCDSVHSEGNCDMLWLLY